MDIVNNPQKNSIQKDPVSLVYIHGKDPLEDVSRFSKANGYILNQCSDIEKIEELTRVEMYDAVLVDAGVDSCETSESRIPDIVTSGSSRGPAVFIILPEYPDVEKRKRYFIHGYDDYLVAPWPDEELTSKLDMFIQLKHCGQKLALTEEKLEKSFRYLDTFKKTLKETKKQLFDERATLNNAFKQISQMTRERNRTKNDLKQLKERFQENMTGFSHLLSHMITTRVEDDKGHGQRVADIAVFIAKKMQIDEKKLEDLRKAAMLHEAGLLLVPEQILKKREADRSAYEKDFFIQYPVKGADLISKCSEFKRCADIIRSLNENSDGTGFPKGLKRKYIPILSRILAGADEFDTLMNDMENFSMVVFLGKLEQLSGARLDPNVVGGLEKYAVSHLGSDSFRVKGIGVHQLEEGMTLGTALFTHTGTKLFSVNTLLTRDAIAKIRRYNREYPVDEIVYIRV